MKSSKNTLNSSKTNQTNIPSPSIQGKMHFPATKSSSVPETPKFYANFLPVVLKVPENTGIQKKSTQKNNL